MRKEYTPIFRGFDSFFGPYNGMIDYYDYTHYIKTDLSSSPVSIRIVKIVLICNF